MNTILLALGTGILYLIAYQTYGKFLAKRIFKLNSDTPTPAVEQEDGVDFVPTQPEILFGHHYTSIAGAGPIVGPALAIIWGWVPALLWIIFGSILMGAVHDFGALVVSLRNQGKTIGEVAADLISPRVRIMFLSIISLALLIVIAIFCLVIASLFSLYPESVIPIWIEIPIAIWLGRVIYKKKKHALTYSLFALAMLYIAVIIGAYYPIVMPSIELAGVTLNPTVSWTIILLIYAYIASTMPVWCLLQPRDYINGHELFVALGLLTLGVIFSNPTMVAPAYNPTPEGAPSMVPFLFIILACGAVSGFHSLVGSGTTSKQLANEKHALSIGYGSMLLEGMLATFAVIAVGAGIGLMEKNGLTGADLWNHQYASWGAAKGLGAKVGHFVEGSAAMLGSLGIPSNIALTIMGVFVVSFACTTLDSATRLQRYALSELSGGLKIQFLTGRHPATILAVFSGGLLALHDGVGKGGLILWPLFGATNQLLACLALLVITVYLARVGQSLLYTLIPFCFMFLVTGWSMYENMKGYASKGDYMLLAMGGVIVSLEIWMVIEASLALKKNRAIN
ncbi:MAG: carbon starvation protein A [Planctomycetes bacterium]|nr:carbon starvation protein A [Planctomycetota bacterium]